MHIQSLSCPCASAIAHHLSCATCTIDVHSALGSRQVKAQYVICLEVIWYIASRYLILELCEVPSVGLLGKLSRGGTQTLGHRSYHSHTRDELKSDIGWTSAVLLRHFMWTFTTSCLS